MSAYLLTPRAKADIFKIWSYIAKDSEAAADRVEQAVYEACQFISENPSAGHSRPELTSRPLHFWPLTRFPNYSIVYRPEAVPLEVVAVMHGRRNLARVLRAR